MMNMLRQSSAQARQASAHFRQCSMWSCFPHSRAHSSHISAQRRQILSENSLPLDMASTANRQISAHSWFSLMHSVSTATSFSLKQALAQWLHITAQSKHFSIQDLNFSWLMVNGIIELVVADPHVIPIILVPYSAYFG